jgi:hypothetical protein
MECAMLRSLVAIPLAMVCAEVSLSQPLRNDLPDSSKPLTMAQVWTLDATCFDQEHGVTFHHPSAWQQETQFGHHPPVLTLPGNPIPIAGFAYDEGGFPRSQIVGPYSDTNLEGFGIVYSAFALDNSAECEAKAAALSGSRRRGSADFGHHSFTVYDTSETGISQTSSGSLYATYAASTCYLFETAVSIASPTVSANIHPLTDEQSHVIEANLEKIMKSVRIQPPKH